MEHPLPMSICPDSELTAQLPGIEHTGLGAPGLHGLYMFCTGYWLFFYIWLFRLQFNELYRKMIMIVVLAQGYNKYWISFTLPLGKLRPSEACLNRNFKVISISWAVSVAFIQSSLRFQGSRPKALWDGKTIRDDCALMMSPSTGSWGSAETNPQTEQMRSKTFSVSRIKPTLKYCLC